MRWCLATIGLLGCSDYGLGNKKPTEEPGTSTTTTPIPPATTSTGATDLGSTPPVDTAPPAPPDCSHFDFTGWSWTGSDPIATEADPVDGAGVPFWDPAYAAVGWTAVAIPDQNTPVGFDRAFRASFALDALPPGMTLDLESDDGIWVWVNGSFAGHWGGDWQQEGCVNENAECLVTTAVPAVDVTALLIVGTNTIAARISNPVQNSWFEIDPACADLPE